MSCGQFRSILTAYVDGELSSEERARFERHLADCPECRRELAGHAKLKEELDMLAFKEPTDVEIERYWRGIYNRLERGIGWVAFSIGAIILLCYGAFKLIEETIRDPNISVLLKVGVVAGVFGGVILLVSLLRERLTLRKVDKYSKEVDR